MVDLVWNGVDLAEQLRDPKAMVHVGGKQAQRCGRGNLLGADRHMQFIGSGKAIFGIVKFPPELMAYDIRIDRRGRHFLILNGKQNAGGGEKENQDNQNRDHGPGQLDLGAAVDLGRLAVVAGITLPEADHHVNKKGGDHNKNGARDLNHEKRQIVNHVRRAGVRLEGVRGLIDDVVSGRSPRRMSGGAEQQQQRISGFAGPLALQPSSKHACGPLPHPKKTHCSALDRQTV